MSQIYLLYSLAHASLNQHAEAVRCYERAVQLEPDNESYQSNLQIAEEKLKQTNGADRAPLGAGMPGMPPGLDVGAMLNNPGTFVLLYLFFLIYILVSLLHFTGLMSMAQQMLSNPNMQQL